MIKAVIFDCFGVLTADRWKEFAAKIPEKAARDKAHDLNHAYGAGFITHAEFIQGVVEITGNTASEIEQLIDNEDTKNVELLRYIASLSKQYKIGLLSNVASNWIRDYFLTPEEQALFDEMVFSFQVGTTKPDPKIFNLICERLGVKPEEAVMVDDIERYCIAAQGMGMQAILYQDFEQLRRDLTHIFSENSHT